MSDSLVLTGVKDVRKHTGTEMLRLNPKGGGDTFQLKRWWVGAGVSTCYEPCTVFDVTTASGTVKLALATKAEGSRVRIDHDGSFNFSFFGAGELSRACLFTDFFEVIEHYVFPNISGGKVMTVTPAGAASRPSGGGATTPTFTAVTLSGATSVDDGDVETYTASVTGTAVDVVHTLSSSEGADVISGMDVTFNGDGNRTLSVSSTSASAGSTNTDSVSVSVTSTPFNAPSETGPKAVEGYYPLYDIEANAVSASADGEAHSHTLSGTTYYMPTGGTLGSDFYHGDYGSNSGGGY